MLKWVRKDRNEVYCECLKDKVNDNINEVVASEDESESAKMEAEYSVVGGGYDKEDEDILQLEAGSLHERGIMRERIMNVASTDEDNAVRSDSNRPISQYEDINDDGVLIPSSTNEDRLFDKDTKKKQGHMCMTLELIMPPLSSR